MSANLNSQALVSVVMLAYNHEPYLRRAIEGVLSQEIDFPIEILIGEDHSTDNTLGIAREYEEKHPNIIRVITSDHNVGAMKNLQRLESSCRGKYVAYCEGDDYWHDSTKLRKQVSFLEQHPDYSFIHTEYRTYIIESGQLLLNEGKQPKNLNDADAYNEMLAGRRAAMTLTVCARHSVLQDILLSCPECYDPRFLMGDRQRWLELARRGRVKCLNEVLATHLALPESASRSASPDRLLRFRLSSKALIEHYIEKYDCAPEIKRLARLRAAILVLHATAELSDKKTARSIIDELRRHRVPISMRAFLHYQGSRSPLTKRITQPMFPAVLLWEKIARRVRRVFISV